MQDTEYCEDLFFKLNAQLLVLFVRVSHHFIIKSNKKDPLCLYPVRKFINTVKEEHG